MKSPEKTTASCVVLFDIDGTLIHTGGAGKAALFQALRSGFDIGEPTQKVEIHGRTDRGITRDLFRHHGIDDLPAHWERFRGEYLRHLPACMTARRGRVLPGIVPLLDRICARDDLLLGLLTGNTRAGAELKLRHYGLADYFDFSFGGFGDDHHDRDDVARMALADVSRRLNGAVSIDRVWVIGDTPGDIRCGRAIGAKVIAVATGDSSLEELAAAGPDHLTSDLGDPTALWALWR